MHHLFKRLLEEKAPKANRAIMRGLATSQLPLAEQYIDTVFRSASKSFPAGLEYVGCERCYPGDEFNEITKQKNNKRQFDLAQSYLFMVKYHFKFNGEPLPPRYMYLPYCTEAGILSLGGSLYHISPVLSDKVISPGNNSVFVKLLRDKINFERCYHSIKVNDQGETSQVVWSQIYRKSKEVKKMAPTTKANICVVHYLVAKFGVSETFKRFLGFVPVVGEEEITKEKYPEDQWVICESMRVKPKTFVGEFYEPTKIKIAIPKDHWNKDTQAYVTGLFYIIDHFPSHMKPVYMDRTNQWMILMGHIIFSGHFGAGKLHEGVAEHFASLDNYVDNIVILRLLELGLKVNDFYDLLSVILQNFNEWVINAAQSSTSLYGKTLEILYYVLYNITSAIFTTNFDLNKLATKKVLTAKDITETMNRKLSTGVIYKLTSPNACMSTVSYSGDHMYPKLTSALAQQQFVQGAARSEHTRTVVDSSRRAHESMTEVGSILFLSKSDPTPAKHINMFMQFDTGTGTPVPRPQFRELLDRTGDMLRIRNGPQLEVEILETEDSIDL